MLIISYSHKKIDLFLFYTAPVEPRKRKNFTYPYLSRWETNDHGEGSHVLTNEEKFHWPALSSVRRSCLGIFAWMFCFEVAAFAYEWLNPRAAITKQWTQGWSYKNQKWIVVSFHHFYSIELWFSDLLWNKQLMSRFSNALCVSFTRRHQEDEAKSSDSKLDQNAYRKQRNDF